jgi:hypothetical protein
MENATRFTARNSAMDALPAIAATDHYTTQTKMIDSLWSSRLLSACDALRWCLGLVFIGERVWCNADACSRFSLLVNSHVRALRTLIWIGLFILQACT